MEENNVVFTEDIYSEHLATISNIKFTPREIDIIACLLSARRTSQIASMLSIAPRTVTTHFRNIMLRLDCNSQEGIINFVERSHKLSILREYYSTLIIELAFKKALKEISKLRREDNPSCLIVYCQGEVLKKALISHLENHLTHAGISAEIREQELDQKIEDLNNRNQILLLLVEKKDNLDITQKPADYKFIDLSEHLNYYLAVFEILQELLPNTDLESIVKKFREQYEGIHSLSGKKYSQASWKEKLDINENRIIYNALQTLKSRKKFFISAFLAICLFAVGVIIFKDNKKESQSYIQTRNAVKEPTIRSDLVIPAEAALLHRPELISQIDEKFKGHNGIQTVAIVGPGGAGKTTLAREYAHQQKANVIWEINAETHENLENSFENLAEDLSKTEEDKKMLRGIQEIRNPAEKQEKIIQFVKERLRLYSNWFLIYDNVEKFTDIRHYFPQDSATWGYGKILLTTRDDNIQNNKHVSSSVQIGELAPHQKLNFFTKIIRGGDLDSFKPIQKEEAREFLEKIPSFPLDVSVAAYYIKATNIPYNKYLESLVQNNKDFSDVQENILKELGDYTKTRYSIITLSLKRLIDTHKDFRDLLLFMSLLDSLNTPRELLEKYKNNVIVDNFIYNLKKYSFITSESVSSPKTSTFSIHRSTQALTLAHLTKALNLGKSNQLKESISETLEAFIADAIFEEDFLKIKLLINHCKKFLAHKNLLTKVTQSTIEGELGGAYYYLGEYAKAKSYLESSIEGLRKDFNRNASRIARVFVYLGNTNRELGNYEIAKELLTQSIEIYKTYPKDQLRVAWALGYLGNIYRTFGDDKKAEELLEESLAIYKKYPKNYTGIAWAYGYLGNIHRCLGNNKKAKILLEESLKIYKEHFSEAHVGVAWALTHLGGIDTNIGNYKKAKEELEEALIIYKKNFDEKHVRVAWATGCLSIVYVKLGEYKKAKSLFEKILIIYKDHLPEDHVDIAWTLLNLGNIYRILADHKKAKNLIQAALLIYEKHFQKNHYRIANTLIQLGNVYKDLGDYKTAQLLFRRALLIYSKHYGKDHFETARVLRNLGQVHLLEGNLKAANKLLGMVLTIFQKNDHPDIYMVFEDLAELYLNQSMQSQNQGNTYQSKVFKKQAKNYLIQVEEIVKTHFSSDSPHLARISAKLKELER